MPYYNVESDRHMTLSMSYISYSMGWNCRLPSIREQLRWFTRAVLKNGDKLYCIMTSRQSGCIRLFFILAESQMNGERVFTGYLLKSSKGTVFFRSSVGHPSLSVVIDCIVIPLSDERGALESLSESTEELKGQTHFRTSVHLPKQIYLLKTAEFTL